MNIDEIALRVAREAFCCQFTALPVSEHRIKAFTHALLAELSKQEPFAYAWFEDEEIKAISFGDVNFKPKYSPTAVKKPLFTHPLPTADIEQRVAEACANLAEDWELNICANKIRSGKWREYL